VVLRRNCVAWLERKKTAHGVRAASRRSVPQCDETPSETRRLRASAQGRFRGERREAEAGQGGQERVFVGQVGAQVAQHDRQGQHCRIVGEAGGQVGVVVAMAIGRAEERQVIVLEGLVIGEGLAQSADLGGQGGGADLAGVDGRQERVAAVEEPAQVGVLGRQLRHHG
jgi:hypothetical protein